MKRTKILTVAIVAIFCAVGFSVMADDNDAAGGVTYHIYLQMNDNTSDALPVNKWLKPYQAETTGFDSFKAALEYGCNDAGMNVTMLLGAITAIGPYSIHGDSEDYSKYYGFTIYSAIGDKWDTVTYSGNTSTYAVVFDKFLSESEYNELSEKDKSGYMLNNLLLVKYASKLPNTSTAGYDNTMLIVAGIVAGVIIIAAAVVLVMRKKHA